MTLQNCNFVRLNRLETNLFSALVLLFLSFFAANAPIASAQSASPVIFFTDLSSGPNSGGESVSGFAGSYVTLYGNFFGTTQGSSTVKMNGSNCMRVVQWGATWLWYQKIVVQLGPTCSSGSLQVVTSAGSSNTSAFAIRAGNIYCISKTGSDSNSGKFPSTCWATMAQAANTMVAGDTVYLENGVSNTSISAFSATVNIETSGTAASPIAFLVYPGATATIGDIHNSQYGIRVPNVGVNPNYIVIGGLTVRGNEAFDAPNGNDHWWLIGNDISCDGSTGFGCLHADSSTNVFVYGNYMHDVGYNCSVNSGNPTGSPCKFHGFYFTTNVNHVWMGWNLNDMDTNGQANAGCYGVQFYSTGGSDQFDLHVHDNVIRNIICGAINFSTVNPDAGPVEAYNNAIYHVGTGPDPSGNPANYFGIVTASSSSRTAKALLYNNSIYDAGGRGNVDNSNAGFDIQIPTTLINNVFQSTGSTELYLTDSTSNPSCNNITGSNNNWFGNGAPKCSTTLVGNLNFNPQYSNLAGGSSSLIPISTSPLIGAGLSGAAPKYDINGLVRSTTPAIGAYEISSGVGTSQLPNPPTNLKVTVQ